MMDSAYLSLPDAAAYLGRSPRWIRRRLTDLPHFRPPGSGLAFRREDLDAFMQRYRQAPMNTVAVVAKILGPSSGRRRRD
jgi:Helix-turn-helix domain